MQIGADLRSPVDAKAAEAKFHGLIERLRVFRGKDLPLPG